jgi:hypothetical protein
MTRTKSKPLATNRAKVRKGPAKHPDLRSEKDILSHLDKALDATGFVGATSIPRLVFLAIYTRWFETPVSVIVQGPTGSGKTTAVERALEFVPTEAIFRANSLSPKALFYSGEDVVKNKILYTGEYDGIARHSRNGGA